MKCIFTLGSPAIGGGTNVIFEHASRMAKEGEDTYKLPKTKFEENYDFSFSGVKTAVLNIANKEKDKLRKKDMCRSFEQNVAEVLVDHTLAIAKEKNIIIEEAKMGKDNPYNQLYFGMYNNLFHNCKYKKEAKLISSFLIFKTVSLLLHKIYHHHNKNFYFCY